MKDQKTISVPVWYSRGGISYRRSALPDHHPEHPYNYIQNELGLCPEDYGVYKCTKICANCGHKLPESYFDEGDDRCYMCALN